MPSQVTYEAVGRRIRVARETAGMTQEELGRMLDTTGATLSRWESGITHVSIPDLVRLASILGASPTYLLSGDQSTEADAMIWQFLNLPEDDRRMVRTLVEFLQQRQRAKAEAAA